MSEPELEGRGRHEETLPPGVDEPGSEEPEADALEQQLLAESGEGSDPEGGESRPEPSPSGEASDADLAEQARVVELDEEEYGE